MTLKMKLKHTPVLLKEVIEYLDPKSGENFIDCTFGGGGHALEILKRIQPDGKLLGIDASVEIKKEIKDWEAEIRERLTLINDNFVNLKQIYEQHFDYPVSGILFDLGISSDELEKSGRGFSFLRDEALDMRFDAEGQRLTAAEVLNKYGYDKLVEIFRDFGEIKDRPAKKAAGQIVKSRRKNRLETTFDLIEIILSVFYPEPFASGKLDVQTKNFYARGKKIIHPATLFFQALRIEVNDELENLEKVLPQAVEILKPGEIGRAHV